MPFDEIGKNCTIRNHVTINKTDGAVLKMGNNCVIDEYATLLLTKPHPELHIGSNVTIGRQTIISGQINYRFLYINRTYGSNY